MGGSGRFGTACAFAVLVALAGCTADVISKDDPP